MSSAAENSDERNEVIFHASAVSVAGSGLLILGASGAGKSTLALRLLSLGAVLISDDMVVATRQGEDVELKAPPTAPKFIEARGVGLIPVELAKSAVLRLIIDLDKTETERLPVKKHRDVLGCPFELLHKSDTPYFPDAIYHYVVGTNSSKGQ